jgi:hypothetical protein
MTAHAHCYVVHYEIAPRRLGHFLKDRDQPFLRQFPKNRPDLYIRTPDGKEAMIVLIVDDKPLYIVRKRLDEIIRHSEDEGWDWRQLPDYMVYLKRSFNEVQLSLYHTQEA